MTRPNILLITTDQQHWDTLSCLGSPVRTPNLDRLAAQGMLCTRAYCPNPTCTPTRASIITGQMPSHHGAWSLGTKLDERRDTIGALLADRAGYATELIGKAHFQPLVTSPEHPSLEAYPTLHNLDFWRSFKERFYGFDHVELARNHVDEAHIGQHHAIWMEDKGEQDWRRWFRPPTGTRSSQDRHWDMPEELHQNSWITERCLARLDQHASSAQPFLLWASYFDPHPPYAVSEPWASMYDPAEVPVPALTPGEHDRNPPHFQATQTPKPDFSHWQEPGGHGVHGAQSHLHDRDELAKDIACYYGMISFLDHKIGELLDHLERLGLADNTLVVFSTDHGHFFGQHGLIAKGPFHYEDALKIPFIVRWPGHIVPGTRSSALQSLVDLAPSFATAAGLEPPLWMSGVDQVPVWTGQQPQARDHVLAEHHHQPTKVHLSTYIDARYKLTIYRGESFGELFDLAEDPGEIHNLWDSPKHLALKAELLLKHSQAKLAKDPLYMPRVSVA